MPIKRYDKLTDDEFRRTLYELLDTADLLAIGDIYAIAAEKFNNAVLDYWEQNREPPEVIVPEPGPDDEWKHPFVGLLIDVNDDNIGTVIDQEDDCWDIDLDRLEYVDPDQGRIADDIVAATGVS